MEDTVKFAKEAAALVSQYPGMKNVSMDWPEETPVVRLKIDQDKVRKLGEIIIPFPGSVCEIVRL